MKHGGPWRAKHRAFENCGGAGKKMGKTNVGLAPSTTGILKDSTTYNLARKPT
jgi:hypothetical protein